MSSSLRPHGLLSSKQEYWSGLPFPSPGDLPDPGIKPMSLESPALQMGSLPLSDFILVAKTRKFILRKKVDL